MPQHDQPTLAEQLKRNGHPATSDPDPPEAKQPAAESMGRVSNADYWASKREKKGAKAA